MFFRGSERRTCGQHSPVGGEIQPEAAEEPAETTISDAIREKYKDADYGGQSFRLAGYSPGEFFYFVVGSEVNEIWYEGMTGDLYTDAVYQRNSLTEDLLNIRIEPQYTSTGVSYDAVSKLIEACVVSGDASVEAGYGSLAYNITSAGRGNMHNFYLIDNIDLNSPWFDQNIKAAASARFQADAPAFFRGGRKKRCTGQTDVV